MEFGDWLASSWSPDLTLGEWWDRFARSGWAAPHWPADRYGLGRSRSAVNVVKDACVAAGVPGPVWGVGYDLAAAVLLRYGTVEQQDRYLFDIVSGRRAWCQLFSEPGAGSDLASLSTRAVRDGDEWVVTGQKVWTTLAHHADHGILLARTDPDAPKHSGITFFAFDMDQPGVEVRPLRQMNGKAEFNEVFLSEARVPHANVVGEVHRGWDVAKTALSTARTFNARQATTAEPGGRAGHLERPAVEFVPPERAAKKTTSKGSRLIPLAAEHGRSDDPLVRQELARLYTMNQIRRYNALRLKAGRSASGAQIASGQKITELATAQLAGDVGARILGAQGMLAGPDAAAGGMVEDLLLTSPSIGIAGGTNDIVRNILGERVLGLAKEPDLSVDVPFRDLPR